MEKLFDNLTDNQAEKILKSLAAHKMHYPQNHVIYPSDTSFIGLVNTGYVQINQIDLNGGKTILEEVEENEIFSSTFSTFFNKDYEILAKEDTEIIWIQPNQIWKSDLKTKEYFQIFLQNFFQIIETKTQEKNERMSVLTKKTIRNRLLEYFNLNSQKRGTKYIYLPFNFTDLAEYLSVDRCAMSRELRYLKEEGFIEIKGKRITLLYNKYNHLYKPY